MANRYDGGGEAEIPGNIAQGENLLLTEKEESLRLTGCSHSGIVNMMSRMKHRNGGEIGHVI